jgi:hypothetical protein
MRCLQTIKDVPYNGVAMWCWLLLSHWCQAMPIFGLQLAESFGIYTGKQIRLKIDHIGSDETK